MEAIKIYLKRMWEIRSTGGATSETSFYSALENLFNDLGQELNPKVICNGQLRNQGAGHPDFGLYSKKQCSRGAPKPGEGEIPERGVIEVKPLQDNTWQTAQGAQATKYFDRYRLVLITNYREFCLIGESEDGNPVQREFFRLTDDETSFWQLASSPNKLDNAQVVYFTEFLHRVMMYSAPLKKAEDVAWFLASYARDVMITLDGKDATALAPLKSALEIALGINFKEKKGDHFFLSTLVQTLFYGIFSAWVVSARASVQKRFDWRSAGFVLTVPMIRALFEEMIRPTRLAPLGIIDILDRTGDTLNRIDRTEFFKSFDTGHAVQHFYEPFLEAFDPELRKEMGVWYTPREIVQYMVERVDHVLRTELGIANGLAGDNVYVLDPCCGTGAFLVEVLRKIEQTLRAQSDDALVGQDIKQAACNRVFGFEILSAPFVIAHWQVGDMLARLNAPLDTSQNERPALYLTNALTGWEQPAASEENLSLFPELEIERDQAEVVKREAPILVVLGNPPYNAFAGTSPEEEEGLVEPYKEGLRDRWSIEKYNLDDLYVRFFRVAERRISQTGRGVVSFISNYSFTREPSFVVMREHLLQSFNKFWVENMHGDRNKSEYAPDGRTSQTIFAIPGFSPGIRQGIVISLAVKTGVQDEEQIVRYRDDIDAANAGHRRQQLLESLESESFDEQYQVADPQPWNKLSFRPLIVSPEYLSWPKLDQLSSVDPFNGLLEKRRGALIDIDRSKLVNRMESYFDDDIGWETYRLLDGSLSNDAAQFNARTARQNALSKENFNENRIVRYITRPFDIRYAYYTEISTIWNRPRPDLWKQYSLGNQFLMSRPSGVANPEGMPIHFTRCLGDNDAQRGHSYYFPFSIETLPGTISANLSNAALNYLENLGYQDIDQNESSRGALWFHALAIAHSPQYLAENKDGISVDWPRIPLPAQRTRFDASRTLGEKIAALLDTESGVDGVTIGTGREHLRILGVISSTNLHVNVGWGSRDRRGRVNPGKGKTEVRTWTDYELKALQKGLATECIDTEKALKLLGQPVDIYLNDDTCWSGVPQAVWNYVIGGYQIIKKWLSYREESVLGRALTSKEAREVSATVRRLAVLLLISDDLDVNYRESRDDAYQWPFPTNDKDIS